MKQDGDSSILTCMVHITVSWVSGVPGLIVPGSRSGEGQSHVPEKNTHKFALLSVWGTSTDIIINTMSRPKSNPNFNVSNQRDGSQ